MAIYLIVLFIVLGASAYWYWSRRLARKSLLATALSDYQRSIVTNQVPLTRKLPTDIRNQLDGKINLFLNQVEFTGCNGLDVTEDMKLSIAAQACLLVVNRDLWYDHLNTVLIYPNAFKSLHQERTGYVVQERETVRTGESWARGPVILSWKHSQQGALNDHDGHNVVFHEFAHKIDELSGRTNGIPQLDGIERLQDWAKAFDIAYKRHVKATKAGQKTMLDPYGASGPQEFFAVAVEAFFEKPEALKHHESEVFQHMSEFFQLDPSTWK